MNLTDIMYILSDGVHDIYSINIETQKITAYRMSGLANGVEEGMTVNMSYRQLMDVYIDNNVMEEDRAGMRAFTEYDSILSELYDKDRFIYHYRVHRNGETSYYYLKCVRVGDEENITDIVFAFTPENNDVNRESLLSTIEMDDLTCVYTRQAFFHQARVMMEEHPELTFDLTIGDVANFKLINSVYGEKMGDDVLKHLGVYFAKNTPPNGIVGRYGGDKFMGFSPSSEKRGREWLLKLINDVNINSPVPDITLKCGVYTNVDKKLSVVQMADRALLAVKSIKHNYAMPYANYSGEVSMAHLRAQTFEAQFVQAMKNNEFTIWYQPKYDAVTEEIKGVEALVRWIMADGTFVSPGEFIPTFEEDGLIVRLDEYVFRKVCESIKECLDNKISVLPISVNLSRATLHLGGTAERYRQIVDEIGIPIELVPLELTESAAIHSRTLRDRMEQLKAAGFVLHMDDFGSGESSLASINILPFDTLKLDKSLIDQIGDPGGDEIVRHTIELAHFKDMNVVAEGVEYKAQLDVLRQLECDMIQGFYFSPPKPYEVMLEYMKKNEIERN